MEAPRSRARARLGRTLERRVIGGTPGRGCPGGPPRFSRSWICQFKALSLPFAAAARTTPSRRRGLGLPATRQEGQGGQGRQQERRRDARAVLVPVVAAARGGLGLDGLVH